MGSEMSIDFLRDGSGHEHQKKAKVLNACLEAGVEPPPAILDYFGGGYDGNSPLLMSFQPKEISDDNIEGWEIDIDDIPEGTKTIRFYRS